MAINYRLQLIAYNFIIADSDKEFLPALSTYDFAI